MFIRAKILPILWLAMLLMLVGCKERISFMKDTILFSFREVSFPDKMLRIENGDTATVAISKLVKPLFIHYYSPNECSDCALNHIRDNNALSKLSRNKGSFDFVVILAPTVEETDYIIEETIKMKLPLSILIDSSHHFQSKGEIPSSIDFSFFMIDTSFRPVYIGNPIQDRRSMFKFEKQLHSLQ